MNARYDPTLRYTHRGRNRSALGALAVNADYVERFIDVECPNGMSFTETITADTVEGADARVEKSLAWQRAQGRTAYPR